jgi:hypothetical protein
LLLRDSTRNFLFFSMKSTISGLIWRASSDRS